MSQTWDDELEGDSTHCRCVCHGTVEVAENGSWRAYFNVPPRFDNAQGWAESCKKCEINHWIAASVHSQTIALEADVNEDANAYLAHFIAKRKV